MMQEFTTCAPHELLSDVLAMMHARGLVHVLLIGTDKQPLGVLNARDGHCWRPATTKRRYCATT